jgi:hypothetical protein
LAQAAILILSGAAFILICSSRAKTRRLACCLGIPSQAFWIHATWSSSQWGMLLLSLVYLGVYIHDLAKLRQKTSINKIEYSSYLEYRKKLPK